MEETEQQQGQCLICSPNYEAGLFEPPTHKYVCNGIVSVFANGEVTNEICNKRHDQHLAFGIHKYDQRLQKTADQLATMKVSQVKHLLSVFKDNGGCSVDSDAWIEEIRDGN